MTVFAMAWLLSVMLLTDPGETVDQAAAEAISRDADRVEISKPKAGEKHDAKAPRRKKTVKEAHVTGRMCDYDRYEGVVMFEGDVVVRYTDDYTMCSDKLYMLMKGSNAVSRVVAVGNVTITNDNRVGTCGMAIYRRTKGEIEMFASADGGNRARLREINGDQNELQGARIRFWIDSEQVEIGDSEIRMKNDTKKRGSNFL